MHQSNSSKPGRPVLLILAGIAVLGAMLLCDLLTGSLSGAGIQPSGTGSQGPASMVGPLLDQFGFLGQSLIIVLPLLVAGAVLALPAWLLRNTVQGHPNRRAGLVIVSMLLACVLFVATVLVSAQINAIFSDIMGTIRYTNLPLVDYGAPSPPQSQINVEQTLRLILPPTDADPCYTNSEVCQWLASRNPGSADPRTWPQYLARILSGLLLLVVTARFAWIFTRPPVDPPAEPTGRRLGRVVANAFGMGAGAAS